MPHFHLPALKLKDQSMRYMNEFNYCIEALALITTKLTITNYVTRLSWLKGIYPI